MIASTAIAWALGHIRLIGYAAAGLALLIFIGWIGHLVEQHKRDARAIAVYESELARAGEINQQNLAEIARLKAEAEKAQAAVNSDSVKTQKRTAAVAKIRTGVSHVAPSSNPVGPAVTAAVAGLRDLKAARAADKGSGRENPHP